VWVGRVLEQSLLLACLGFGFMLVGAVWRWYETNAGSVSAIDRST